MANQRKKGKRHVGVWLTDAEKAAMMKAAKKAGFNNLADWLRSLINIGGKMGLLAVMSLISLHLGGRPGKIRSAMLAELTGAGLSKSPRAA
jgi:hypothetical protein